MLREVDAVIGVVTSSFVASNWCSAELGIASALGCRLMPLRAEAAVVHPLMPRLQYADYHDDPGQARDRVLHAVRLLQDGGGTWRHGDNPFLGLEPFTAALSRVFFGRTADAREVGNRSASPNRSVSRCTSLSSAACLLSDTDDDGQGWLTVVHEALFTGWRPLDTATADITVALRTARTVEQAAADWNSADRPEHYLWDRERLTTTLTTLGIAGDGGRRNPGFQPIIELDVEALAFLDAPGVSYQDTCAGR